MAKNNNLGDFLKGIADKIRTKLSSSDLINPQDFEDKIDTVYESGRGQNPHRRLGLRQKRFIWRQIKVQKIFMKLLMLNTIKL